MFTRWYRNRNRRRPRSPYGNLIAYMKQRLNEQPADQRLRLSLVRHLEMAGRYEEAILQVKQLLVSNPHHHRAKGMLIRLKLEQRFATQI
jgi:Flp pilus assembly protein TadD